MTDEGLLNLLEPKEYEVEYEKILKREDISLQVIARVERCLKQSTVKTLSHFHLSLPCHLIQLTK